MQREGEKSLRSALKKLFPSDKTYYNAKKIAGMKKEGKKKDYYWELDVWIPELNLGFEYQV